MNPDYSVTQQVAHWLMDIGVEAPLAALGGVMGPVVALLVMAIGIAALFEQRVR